MLFFPSTRTNLTGGALAALAALAVCAQEAQAVTFFGSGVNSATGVALSSSVDFTVSGSTLTVVLRNTGPGAITASSDVLTGIFFNVTGGSVSLTPGSALLNGSTVTNNGPDGGGNVGGEWAYGASLGSGSPQPYGISSAGLGLFGQANFNGPDLSPPPAVDGINYGIVNAGYVNGQGNGGINTQPLIRDAVTFALTGLPSGFDLNRIGQVQFQYGTSLTEPNLIGIPEPSSTLGLLMLGALGAAARRKKTHA